MSMLKQSALLARCDVCRLHFDPVFGGICPQCGKLLCAQHLFGSTLYRLASYVALKKPCVECRAKNKKSPGGPQ